MIKRKTKLLVLFIFIVGLAGFYLVFKDSQMLAKSTNLSRESINGVKIHENIKDYSFTKEHKKPLHKKDNSLYDYYVWGDGLETASVISGKDKGNIKRLIISKSKYSLQTSKGIELGDKKEDILKQYGENYFKRNEQGADIIGYLDRKNNMTLEFWLSNNQVAEIRLDDSNVE